MKIKNNFAAAVKKIISFVGEAADGSSSMYCMYQPKEVKKPECLKKSKENK